MPVPRGSSQQQLLVIGREYDRNGHLEQAADAYEAAFRSADASGDAIVSAEALRRLALVRHRRQDPAAARGLCRRSEAIARQAAQPDLAAEALNTLGGFDLLEERFEAARDFFLRAETGARNPDLRGRIEQNLGTVAGILGDHVQALERYRRSLAGFLEAKNEHGCAVAYHNLGAISLDRRRWQDAERYLRLCLLALQHAGDLHLRGLATLNRAEALVALGRVREARLAAETATQIFEELHSPRDLCDAYRILGAVSRHEGQLGQAQSKLRLAIEVAAAERCAMTEAEASRELAMVLALQGRRDEASATMSGAARALDRLKPAALSPESIRAGEMPAGVRARAELLGVMDPAALARAERVATGAAQLGRALGCDAAGQARLWLGGFLHQFDPEQLGDGLAWDVRPAVRCHRERRDGSGPGGLRGEAIPADAEIIGVVAAYDRDEVTEAQAAAWWRPEIVSAYRCALAA
jgi:tetratricopeptide (TPR) repeat protein